jgi:hypothetical protein
VEPLVTAKWRLCVELTYTYTRKSNENEEAAHWNESELILFVSVNNVEYAQKSIKNSFSAPDGRPLRCLTEELNNGV